MMSRAAICFALIGLSASLDCATAQDRSMPVPKAQSGSPSLDPAEVQYQAARKRAEAREREWDRKMQSLTKSVCTGC
jgi:hypothetical protein